MEREKILSFLKQNKPFLEKKYKVMKIGLFGSYATGTNTEESDIDIIVSMPSNFDDFYDLKEFLEKNLHCTVDLGLEKNLRPIIKASIKDEIIYV